MQYALVHPVRVLTCDHKLFRFIHAHPHLIVGASNQEGRAGEISRGRKGGTSGGILVESTRDRMEGSTNRRVLTGE